MRTVIVAISWVHVIRCNINNLYEVTSDQLYITVLAMHSNIQNVSWRMYYILLPCLIQTCSRSNRKRQRRYHKRVAELKSTYAPSYVYASSPNDIEPDYDTYGSKLSHQHMTNTAYNPEIMSTTDSRRSSERIYQTPMMVSPGTAVSLPLPPPDYGNLGYEYHPEEMSERPPPAMVYHYQDSADSYAQPHVQQKPAPYLYVQVEEGIHYY